MNHSNSVEIILCLDSYYLEFRKILYFIFQGREDARLLNSRTAGCCCYNTNIWEFTTQTQLSKFFKNKLCTVWNIKTSVLPASWIFQIHLSHGILFMDFSLCPDRPRYYGPIQVKCRLLNYDIFLNEIPTYFGKCHNYVGNLFKNMS